MAEETPRQHGGDGVDEESGRFGRAKEYMGEQYERASDAMRDSYNNIREKVEDADFGEILGQVRTYVRSHPGKALLISVAAGFVVGLLLRRDEGEE